MRESYDTMNGDDNVPPDDLDHEVFAERIAELTESFDSGSVVSIEENWGRGKTDILNRLHRKTTKSARLWIDPWFHKENIVLELAAEVQKVNPGAITQKLSARIASYLFPIVRFGINSTQAASAIVDPATARDAKRWALLLRRKRSATRRVKPSKKSLCGASGVAERRLSGLVASRAL